MQRFLCAFAFVVGLGGLGCGDDPCEEAAEALCARACECGDAECAFGDGGGTFSFETKADCLTLYKFACSQGDPDIDWDQCIADTEAGQCMDSAFPTPMSCEEQQ